MVMVQVSFKHDEQWQGWKRKFLLEYLGGCNDIPDTVKMGGGSITQTSVSQMAGLTFVEKNVVNTENLKEDEHNLADDPYSYELSNQEDEQERIDWCLQHMNLLEPNKESTGQVRGIMAMMGDEVHVGRRIVLTYLLKRITHGIIRRVWLLLSHCQQERMPI